MLKQTQHTRYEDNRRKTQQTVNLIKKLATALGLRGSKNLHNVMNTEDQVKK